MPAPAPIGVPARAAAGAATSPARPVAPPVSGTVGGSGPAVLSRSRAVRTASRAAGRAAALRLFLHRACRYGLHVSWSYLRQLLAQLLSRPMQVDFYLRQTQ